MYQYQHVSTTTPQNLTWNPNNDAFQRKDSPFSGADFRVFMLNFRGVPIKDFELQIRQVGDPSTGSTKNIDL